ncbi:hypothetical protein [Candidatus Entotheonella palauensis]|uniref:Uncharacterized protein n=1 Tax=Candidatus Entotheonella gemina TaxID=1429439 RepID=W4MAE1_9BACT|nr:hypothetical protein [Candidatus Entotheonella palauensis]ETX06861.1 MAG: hypothetical protein ETSY2_14560 [Candidatus Entotheonella gemina]
MSDKHQRYRAIHEALKQCYPGEPSGRMAQHLTTLAAFISGMVGSKSSQLPNIATKIADRVTPDSRVQRAAGHEEGAGCKALGEAVTVWLS